MNQYLLPIAQKIIYKSAPVQIIKKYEQLKKSITYKADIQEIQNWIDIPPIVNNSSRKGNKKKQLNLKTERKPNTNNSVLRPRMLTSYSTGKVERRINFENGDSNPISRMKLNTNPNPTPKSSHNYFQYPSRNSQLSSSSKPKQLNTNFSNVVSSHSHHKRKITASCCQVEHRCLCQIASLLQRAEIRPQIIENVEFREIKSYKQSHKVTYEVMKRIEGVLKRIFINKQNAIGDSLKETNKTNTNITKTPCKKKIQFQIDLPELPAHLSSNFQGQPIIKNQPIKTTQQKQLSLQELLKDNKWLIEKLQMLVKENGVLRRMVDNVSAD